MFLSMPLPQEAMQAVANFIKPGHFVEFGGEKGDVWDTHEIVICGRGSARRPIPTAGSEGHCVFMTYLAGLDTHHLNRVELDRHYSMKP